jgi:hypothetical protein
VYRDDVCAVCGESLPPDHFYCREHAATVDDRLHEVGELLRRVSTDLDRLAVLLPTLAAETWEWLADAAGADDVWPPEPDLVLRADPDEVEVEADDEPGYVRVRVTSELAAVVASVASALADPRARNLMATAAAAEGANATH